MKKLKIKKIIISSRIGIYLDSKIRLFISMIPLYHSLINRKNIPSTPDRFVFFLYGGVGDAVLVFPLIQKLSHISKTIIFCDSTISNLSYLLPENAEIIIYEKNSFLRCISDFRKRIAGLHAVFIQTSPVIEMYIIRLLLRIPYSIGLISSFRTVRSIGFNLKPRKINSHSRLYTYDAIFESILSSFDYKPQNIYTKNPHHKNISYDSSVDKIEGRYIVISPTKSFQWEMGKMPIQEYTKLANYLTQELGYKVIFVGHVSEQEYINNIVDEILIPDMGINLAGRTSLKDLASVICGAELVIANDNGIAHLSSYLEVKTLVLFMFSNPKVYEWNNENYSYIFNKTHNCMPCVSLNRYPQDNYPVLCNNNLECNVSITANDIINKINLLGWV